jgi:hypothetical protein
MVNECYVLCLVFLTSWVSITAVLGDDMQSQDVKCFATALMSEASVGTDEERAAVAWTIFNRVSSPNFPNSICDVINQRSQYATNQEPTQELLDLAESLIANRGTDPTGGAVYFFSPRSMPKEGDDTSRYDIGGGLHDVTGIDKKVYFPSFTLTHEYAGDLQGVRPAYYMFYQEQSTQDTTTAPADVVLIGFPVTLTLYVHEGDADGPSISGVRVTGRDGAGHDFDQTTDSDGYVTITGISGTWSFLASADGYEPNNWDQEISETDRKDAFILKEDYVESTVENDVLFPDPNLEAAIREAINKPEGVIYAANLEDLTYFGVSQKGIKDINGLEYCTNLQRLYLGMNQISDVSPLVGLTNLQDLDLGYNQISDVSPLAGLANLQYLGLGNNQISDLSPLARLTNLQQLVLEANQISDLSPLAGLTKLQDLRLNGNQILDVSPLSELTNLQWLDLSSNDIILDLSPLAGLTTDIAK